MQAACWSGRKTSGVAAHLYVELDGAGLDPDRLTDAVAQLYQHHPMLRMRVTPGGQQMVLPFSPQRYGLAIDDFRRADPAQARAALKDTRNRMTHQALALADGQACEFRLSRLADGRYRLHVDLDMIAADPSCFGRLMDDLARFYRDPAARAEWLQPCYLDLIRPPSGDGADRDWWRAALANLPDGLRLPPPAQSHSAPRSTSLSAHLDADDRAALRARARAARVTMPMLALAIFARIMAQATGQADFRLTVPHFLRPAGHPHGDLMVGDFSGLVIVAVRDALSAPVEELAHELSRQVAAGLSHGNWPAVAAMRDLSRDRGRIETSPVVFTAGFGLPERSILTRRARDTFGDLVWAVSQGPGVALDVQLAELGDGLLLNWDLRLDMIDRDWADRAFARHLAALRAAVPSVPARPLGPLAQAYLLGRGDALPLGGVAMQEFREYRGALPPETIAARLVQLVAAHPALRSRIDAIGAVQYHDECAVPEAEIIDLRDSTPDDAEAEIARHRGRFAHHVDDLDGPPWALRLYRMPAGAADATVALLRFDALVLDGLGISRVIRQLFGTDDLVPQGTPDADALPPSSGRSQAEAWWRARLADVLPPDLPWRTPPDRIGHSLRARHSVTLPRADWAGLKRIGARAGLMPNTVLTALILDTLARWTPDLAFSVAVPVAAPSGGVLGNRSTFIVLPYDGKPGTLPERAAQIQKTVVGGLSHLAFSGVDLTRLLLAEGDARIALPVVLTNGLGWDAPDADAPMRWTDGLTQTPQVALDIRLFLDATGNLTVAMDYAVEALERDSIDAMLAAIRASFDAVLAGGALPDALPDALPVAVPFAHQVPDTPQPYPWLARIAGHLADPQAGIALIQNGRTVTYAQLHDRVRAMIAGLRARGMTGGKVLAICLPRGLDHLALQLAAAFEGVIWVPIDAASPAERLLWLLENCGADLVAGDAGLTPGLPDHALSPDRLAADAKGPVLDQDTLAARSLDEGPGYYLYTSGTTGRPKCVVLSNRATANVLGATCPDWGIGAGDRAMSVTPPHHDMSVFDLFGTLSCGAAVVMPDTGADKDAVHWAGLVAAHGVTLWVSVPAIVEMLLACAAQDQLASLRLVAQGGDYIRATTIAALRRLVPGARLISLGGPTETVIWSIWHQIAAGDDGPVPYGRALPGNRYHILDPLGRPAPPGVVGRIHSSGVNLALGYLKDGALDQTDFVALADGTRAFRSGDLGRWRDDGAILFAGRVDGYVKIRGVRVSLPDIAAAILQYDQVDGVIVVDLLDPVSGEATLGALYAAGDVPGSAALRRFLGQALPPSHIPSHLHRVAELPLSRNGKPDRAAARAILSGHASAGDTPAEGHCSSLPVAQGQDVLAPILHELRSALAAPDMSADDDFFDMGGHSLTATRIVGRLASQHGIRVRFDDIFSNPTARKLALCAVREQAPPALGLSPAASGDAPLSLAQASLWKVYEALGKGDIFNIPFAMRFLDPVDEEAFGAAFRDLLIRHDILRSLFVQDAAGAVRQRPVPPERLDDFTWFWRSADSRGISRADEAGHVFDLGRELPLRLRFLREEGGQVLSLLFHHVVLDEWSVDLLMNDLALAYQARSTGHAPQWGDPPAPFADFARAQADAGPGGAHLAWWVEMLRDPPARRPFVASETDHAGQARTDGGWREIAVPAAVGAGLHRSARACGASLFNIVYAAIAAALRDVSGQDDLVIGTSAAGRGDPLFFDTVGYFTTVVAHRLRLPDAASPRALTGQVRDMINGSLPHDEIPIDLVEAALGHPGPEHLFEAFIQIHAGNRMNGILTGPDGAPIRYRQIDPEKSESLLGLQFEVLEDVIDGKRNLRVMMSYRTDSYGPADVARLESAVSGMFARFADAELADAPVGAGRP